MAELVTITLPSGEIFRCASLADAKNKAAQLPRVSGKVIVETTPEGGGLMEAFEFDQHSGDLTPI